MGSSVGYYLHMCRKKLLEAKQGTRGKGKRNRIQKEKRIQFPDLKQIQE